MMKNSRVLQSALLLLGLILTVLGAWRLTDPVGFYANSGIALGNDIGMLSEARGAGGVVVGAGVLILLGVFIRRLTYTASVVTIMIFLSYGLARLVGLALDGVPGGVVVQGLIFELVFASVGILSLYKYRAEVS